MEAKVKMNMNYYEFLGVVQEVSKKSKAIQRNLINKIYENYDIQQVKNRLIKQIENLDRLIIK
ncbi:MAG: hypothetical protein ACFFB0_19945 [Promethearchaeota archaeon]